MTSVHDFSVKTAEGAELDLGKFAGQVLLIVNVASQCGFTPQYEALEKIQRDYAERGLQVLGFPCNQFGGQEPGSDVEIQQFCSTTYGVSFPVLAKIDVNGPETAPLYRHLRAEQPGTFGPEVGAMYEFLKASRPETIGTDEIKWNFTKFLVGRDGEVISRFESAEAPDDFRADIEKALAH